MVSDPAVSIKVNSEFTNSDRRCCCHGFRFPVTAAETSAIPSEVPAENLVLQRLHNALATPGDVGHVEPESRSLVKAWLGELDWVGMAALQNGPC